MHSRACLPVTIALCVLAATEAFAERLTGTVTLTHSIEDRAPSSIPAYPGMLGTTSNGPAVAGAADARDVVLFIPAGNGTSIPSRPSNSSRATNKPQLVQIGQRFQPHVLGVTVGTTVAFPNADPVFHNVFSYSKAKRFDLGKYGQGKSKSVTFDSPGIIKVFCEIHSDMTAYILVADTPLVTQPDEDGQFEFEDVPAGRFEMHAWHPARGTRIYKIDMDAPERSVHVEL